MITRDAPVRNAIVAVMVYAPLAAELRRIVEFEIVGIPDHRAADLMLAPIPVAGLALGFLALRRGVLRDRSAAMNATLALLALAIIGVFNPRQGGLEVGLLGLAYLGIPFLWFFVAKAFVDDATMRRVLIALLAVSIPISIYAIAGAQDLLASWDRAFLGVSTHIVIWVDGVARPLSTFASPEELGRFLATAMIVATVLVGLSARTNGRRLAVAALVLLLATALAFNGVRAGFVLYILAVAVVAAARRGVRPAHALGIVAVGLVLLVGAARVVSLFGDTGLTFVDRTVAGLSVPWGDENSSTGREHLKAQLDVVRGIPDRWLGLGTGATTPAADRLGEAAVVTESDVGDAVVSWGIPGLMAWAAFVVTAGASVLRVAWRRRDPLALATMGVLLTTLLRWTEGGMYAMAPLVWICFGWFNRADAELGDG